MPIAYLTRSVAFSAGHRYYRPEWSDERNREVFGACANPVGHGHNYVLEATVRGSIDATTGFSADLGEVDAVLRREVVDRLDHQHLNEVVDEFHKGTIPTTENILVHLWPRITASLPPGIALARLRLREMSDLYVDYFGGGRAPGDD
jgi:6-pyruvoyltetrahydropterin/6-carboxytetrahydropterin synthase